MENKRIDEIYPDHLRDLIKARLIDGENLPIMKELWRFKKVREENKNRDCNITDESGIRKHKKDQNVYFCISYCSFWKSPTGADGSRRLEATTTVVLVLRRESRGPTTCRKPNRPVCH